MKMRKIFTLPFFILSAYSSVAQNCNLNIQWKADIPTSCPSMTMSMLHDRLDRPYLYVANKEAGLKIYHISSPASPVLSATVPISQLDSLEVMAVTQTGSYLYLALGNTFNSTQPSGMAIMDVTNPAAPVVTDTWQLPSSKGGSGIAVAEGDYAYLGAMGNGLVILDISNKSAITFVSRYIPDLKYPDAVPDSAKINARGMEVKNGMVYLCYDAGGFRIINTADKLNPKETGRYSNPLLNGKPRAYNNVVIDDTLAYIAVDYCGVEVLNIADTSNITLAGWWNPYNCPNNNWFSSPVHSNEMRYDKNCSRLFLSTGKSDMVVLDVTDPTQPDSCNFYGGVSNNTGTWGIDMYKNKIFLSYVCAIIPFSSNWTGVKILTYDPCLIGTDEKPGFRPGIFPNPSGGNFVIDRAGSAQTFIVVTDLAGRRISFERIDDGADRLKIRLHDPAPGIYFLKLESERGISSEKIIVQ